ncbi:MAG: hypothetical protein WDW36_005009 [Sanguina aurantia]
MKRRASQVAGTQHDVRRDFVRPKGASQAPANPPPPTTPPPPPPPPPPPTTTTTPPPPPAAPAAPASRTDPHPPGSSIREDHAVVPTAPAPPISFRCGLRRKASSTPAAAAPACGSSPALAAPAAAVVPTSSTDRTAGHPGAQAAAEPASTAQAQPLTRPRRKSTGSGATRQFSMPSRAVLDTLPAVTRQARDAAYASTLLGQQQALMKHVVCHEQEQLRHSQQGQEQQQQRLPLQQEHASRQHAQRNVVSDAEVKHLRPPTQTSLQHTQTHERLDNSSHGIEQPQQQQQESQMGFQPPGQRSDTRHPQAVHPAEAYPQAKRLCVVQQSQQRFGCHPYEALTDLQPHVQQAQQQHGTEQQPVRHPLPPGEAGLHELADPYTHQQWQRNTQQQQQQQQQQPQQQPQPQPTHHLPLTNQANLQPPRPSLDQHDTRMQQTVQLQPVLDMPAQRDPTCVTLHQLSPYLSPVMPAEHQQHPQQECQQPQALCCAPPPRGASLQQHGSLLRHLEDAAPSQQQQATWRAPPPANGSLQQLREPSASLSVDQQLFQRQDSAQPQQMWHALPLAGASLQHQQQQQQHRAQLQPLWRPSETHHALAPDSVKPECSVAVAVRPVQGTIPSFFAVQECLEPAGRSSHMARVALPDPSAAAVTVARPATPPPHHVQKPGLRQDLTQWIPHAGIAEAFIAKGVGRLYPWQAAALELGEDCSNLVYCAPTSGGKSLVAEVLMIRRLLVLRPRPAAGRVGFVSAPPARGLYILPYVSIVNEKTQHLTHVLGPAGLSVRGYCGMEVSSPLGPRGEDIAICTIEKANAAINKLVKDGRLGELVCIIVDEVHMVSDEQRGLALEILLTKVMHGCARDPGISIQVVAMSATISGLDAMCAWLRARLFMTNFRPVPLVEHAVFQGCVYKKLSRKEMGAAAKPAEGAGLATACPLSELRQLSRLHSRDQDRLLPLISEVVEEGHSVLVFCAGRRACESCADLVAQLLAGVLKVPTPDAVLAKRALLIQELQDAMAGHRNGTFEALLRAGVAYHHAGLTIQERNCVESGYRSGALQVLMATSTLAAGINLPARRVILRTLWQGVSNVGRAQYLQMIGRAGRAGQSTIGESFLMGRGGTVHPP